MRLLLCLLLLATAKSSSVLYLDGNGLSHAIFQEGMFYVNFPEVCEVMCRAEIAVQMDKDTSLLVLQDPFYHQRLIVTAEGASALDTTDELILDPTTLTLFHQTQRVELRAGKLVSLTFTGTSLEARFALRVGSVDYNFWQLTVGFPVLVQRVRMWADRFYFPFIFGFLTLVFFLSWPLQKKRPDSNTILTSLAMLSLLAWTGEAFYHYFLITSMSNERSIVSFLLHIVSNLSLVFALGASLRETITTRRTVTIIVALASCLVGGAGGYLCPALLYLELVLLRAPQKGKLSSVICKSV